MTTEPGEVLTQVELTPAQARWLSVLAAARCTAEGESAIQRGHYAAWEALQAACRWTE